MSYSTRSGWFTVDPAWPWSTGGIGLDLLAMVAMVLIVLTVWTYRDVRGASRKRILILLGLRLTALMVACLASLRPSISFHDELRVPSTLLIAADSSESMSVQDQHKNQSRWDYLQRLLSECQPQLDDLRDKYNISVVHYAFAGAV